MNEEMTCSIVRDLLPGYIGKTTSSETSIIMEKHLATCDSCKKAYEEMIADVGNAERVSAIKHNSFKKRIYMRIIGAVSLFVITLLCMYALYSKEFSVDATDTTSLEAAIDEYFFTENVDAEIIKSQREGNLLFVFFEREGYQGHYGIATLEAGLFGKCRFRDSSLDDWPLYNFSFPSPENYLLLYGINDLQRVATYAVYPDNNTSAQPIYQGQVEKAPFLRIIKLQNPESYPWKDFVHYYDANGDEIDIDTLLKESPQPVEGNGATTVGSVEFFWIYVCLSIVFILGIALVVFLIRPCFKKLK